MSVDLPSLTDAARDPESFIPRLEEMQEAAKKHLRGISFVLRELRKIRASTDNLEYFQAHGVPRPRDPNGHGADDEAYEDEANESDESAGGTPRRERVMKLLAQETGREWKVRDIAVALRIDNIKSLRTSMDDFVKSGVVEKNLESSTYFLGRKGYQASF